MHARVKDTITKYEKARDFMEIYMLVQRQKQRKSASSEERDTMS